MEQPSAISQLESGCTPPPSYSTSVAYLSTAETVIQTEEPPSHVESDLQNVDVQQPGSKSIPQEVQLPRVVYSQPVESSQSTPIHRPEPGSYQGTADLLLLLNIFCCVFCCLFATPFTLICFLPAISYSVKVRGQL